MMKTRISLAVATALVILFTAVVPVTADGETIFEDIITGNIDTGTLAVEGYAYFGGPINAQEILSPTISNLQAQNEMLQSQIWTLQTQLTNLQRRVACVENKPNQVRPKCPTS